MAVIGTPRNYHAQFKFVVEIDGIASAAFQTCSELAAEVADREQWEGGSMIADKQPGRLTVDDITLERGATTDRDIYEWFRQVANAAANAGLSSPGFKRNLDIVQQDLDGSELRRWRVYSAYPKRFVGGAWDNDSDDNVMETVVLRCDYFELIQ